MSKILIVDDSPTMRQMLLSIIKRTGSETVEAANGKEALERLKPDMDLVLTDYHMPEMGGQELVDKIRKGKVNPKIPILILTTERSEQIIEECRQAGASGWINKPVKSQQLLETIDRFLLKMEF